AVRAARRLPWPRLACGRPRRVPRATARRRIRALADPARPQAGHPRLHRPCAPSRRSDAADRASRGRVAIRVGPRAGFRRSGRAVRPGNMTPLRSLRGWPRAPVPRRPAMTNRAKPELPEDLEEAITRLKREKGAIILAHYYQESEIQDLADVVGDSLQLARPAQKVECGRIVVCGVHLLAETAATLHTGVREIVPDLEAGCSLADGCPPEAFKAFIAAHPGAKVLTYINTSAAVKALSDLICTSSNAVKMVEHFKGEKLIFAPDRHLARWVAR